jgi:thiol-disulfide isomerase/thioredoxin
MRRTIQLLLLLSLISVCVRAGEPALPRKEDPSGERTGIADYNLKTLRGEDIRLSSLRGKVVLFNFFHAKCPHCREHAPFLSGLEKRLAPKGLVVIAICAHNYIMDREIVQEYANLTKMTGQIVFAPTDVLLAYMHKGEKDSYSVPQAALFGTDGVIIARFLDWEEKDKAEMEKTIEKELSRQPKPATK